MSALAQRADFADDKIAHFLALSPVFAPLDHDSLAKLAARMRSAYLPAGEVLIREGEPGDAVYVVVSGRLRVSVQRPEGELAVNEIGRGEMVGEMALLTDEPRSATVRAVRDTHVLRLSRAHFLHLIERRPAVLLATSRLIIGRLQRSNRAIATPSVLRTIAVVPAGGGADLLAFCEKLGNALETHGSVMLLNRERLESQLRHLDAVSSVGERLLLDPSRLASQFTGTEPHKSTGEELDAETTQWLNNIESSEDFVIYQCDPEPSPWTTRCLRQADRILLVGEAEGNASLGPIEGEMRKKAGVQAGPHHAEQDLVLLYSRAGMRPRGTFRWLKLRRHLRRHHHVRLRSRRDFERLARVLVDRQVGIVLGGGGARGIAHVGVLRALEEHRIPVDLIGGTSFGAIMAAGPAMGWDAKTLREGVKRTLVDPGPPVDYTAPIAALTKGEKATEQIYRTFGDYRIEDLWLPFFCVSSNLTRGVVKVHSQGLLWQAIRASVALPGVLPPIRSHEGDVLVDGGIMNNLPVDVMRSLCRGGLVLAVNVRPGVRMEAGDLSDSGVVSGWELLARRLNPFGPRPAVPSIIQLITRTTETGNVLSTRLHEQAADLTFNPDVSEFGLLQFDAYDQLIEKGYEHAMERLERWSSEVDVKSRVPSELPEAEQA